MKYRVIGIDVDGTLVTHDDRITEENMCAIAEACDKGIHCAIATGRPLGAVPYEIVSVPGMNYCLTSNGGIVHEIIHGAVPAAKLIKGNFLSPQETLVIISIIREAGAKFEIIVDNYGYAERDSFDAYMERMRGVKAREDYLLGSRRVIASAEEFFAAGKTLGRYPAERYDWKLWLPEREEVPVERVENVVVFAMSVETGARLRETFTAMGYYVVSYEDHILEVVHRCTNKGSGLLGLADALDIPREETMGIGDSYNDMELLKEAGLGVAMGNSHKKLLEYADVVTDDNENSGVGRAIRKYALSEV